MLTDQCWSFRLESDAIGRVFTSNSTNLIKSLRKEESVRVADLIQNMQIFSQRDGEARSNRLVKCMHIERLKIFLLIGLDWCREIVKCCVGIKGYVVALNMFREALNAFSVM